MPQLTSARYGKERVRLLRVVKNGDWHEVVEYTVNVMLEGELESSFSAADNSVIVATDSMKNTVHVFAKTSPHVLTPELFSLHLGQHFVSEYNHIKKAIITITSHRWSRLPIGAQPHPHAFVRDGNDTVQVQSTVIQGDSNTITATLTSGFKDLLVLKTTGSAFENFIRDKWTTLPEVSDRILSTSIDCKYELELNIPDGLTADFMRNTGINFKELIRSIREITLETFAKDESASVQATLYKMGELALSTHKPIISVSYSLPNKHYVPIDLSWHNNIQNTKVGDADVYLPLDAPAGLITATVSR